MKFCSWIILLASIVQLGGANPNILTPFGRCKNVPHLEHFVSSQLEGVWFLQLTTDIPGHNSPYSCQTSFEYVLSERSENLQTSDVTLSVNIFYASNGKTVRQPMYFEFRWDPVDHVFRAETNIDGNDMMLYYYVLNQGSDERLVYMCTDNPQADADRDAVFLWSRIDEPLDSVFDEAIANITSIFYPELKKHNSLDDEINRSKNKKVLMNRVNQMAEECDVRQFYTIGSRYLRELYLQLHKS